MMLRLKRAIIITRKHILDNKVSENIKTMIREEYKIQMKLVPP